MGGSMQTSPRPLPSEAGEGYRAQRLSSVFGNPFFSSLLAQFSQRFPDIAGQPNVAAQAFPGGAPFLDALRNLPAPLSSFQSAEGQPAPLSPGQLGGGSQLGPNIMSDPLVASFIQWLGQQGFGGEPTSPGTEAREQEGGGLPPSTGGRAAAAFAPPVGGPSPSPFAGDLNADMLLRPIAG